MIDLLKREHILLTPGPLSTSKNVRMAMLKDSCTWDVEYNTLVQDLRKKLLNIATKNQNDYTVIPMQGSGTFAVESVLTTVIGKSDKVLVISNGAYGDRISKICDVAGVNQIFYKGSQKEIPSLEEIEKILKENSDITHVAMVHCETTSGILNPIKEIGVLTKKYNKIYIVDAMSSFGGISFDLSDLQIDFMISSANKCIQGVPGFGFIIAKISELQKVKGQARSYSLDIYDQWEVMEKGNGKWRFTSPTHVVKAFYQAICELEIEGGVTARETRYNENQKTLVEGMRKLGFKALISRELQSPIITTFLAPNYENYTFEKFYQELKNKGFIIYPGKLTEEDSFRIGNIGEIYPKDIEKLVKEIENSIFWR